MCVYIHVHNIYICMYTYMYYTYICICIYIYIYIHLICCSIVTLIILCHNVCFPMLFMTKFLTCLIGLFLLFDF